MNHLFSLLGLFALLSCASPEQVKNDTLRDKVLACGLMFNESLQVSLGCSVDKHYTDGKIGEGFNESVKGIFSELPEADREKAYEAYLDCLKTLKVSAKPLNSKGC
jgi:hypothetical protein